MPYDALFMSLKQLGKALRQCGNRHLPDSCKQSAHIHRNFRVRRANQWASMDVCDRKRGRVWRHPRLFSHSCCMCTDRCKDRRESKSEGQCQHQSESGTDHQWSVGRKRERQRLSKVRPRALCVSDRCRTNHALSRMDLVGTPCTLIKVSQDEAVNFREKNTNRTEDGGLATGSGGPCAGPHAGLRTNTLPGQDSGSHNPTLSNDWTGQMQVLMSNPELAQEQFAQRQFLHQHFQHLQYQQQLAASSTLESWQMFEHSSEDGESVGGQSSMDARMDQTGV